MVLDAGRQAGQRVLEALAGEPAPAAVLLAGSHAVGTATPGSDIDFTVLVDDEAAIEHVLGRLETEFALLGSFHEVPHFRFASSRLAVCTYHRGWVDDWVAHAFRSAGDLRQWQGWLQHKIVDAVALHDPGDLLRGYQRHLRTYPAALADEVAAQALEHLHTAYLDDWGFRNAYHFAYCLRDILEHLGTALFARNRRFYAPPLKHWHRQLASLKPPLEEALQQLVALSPEADLAGKRELLLTIVERLRATKTTGA